MTSIHYQITRPNPALKLLFRILIYSTLIIAALFFIMPLYIMIVNSLKPLAEIRSGNLLTLPGTLTFQPWITAWSEAQIGVNATGLKPYFLNSFLLVIPSVVLSTLLGALNGYILTKFNFKWAHWIFVAMLFSVFIPFQIVLVPMATTLGFLGLAGTIQGLIFVNVIYGIGFTTLFFRNYYAAFPDELIKSARMDGAGFFQVLWRILLPNSTPIIVVSVIWQFTNIWNEFLFGVSFSDFDSFPITVALNNLVSSSTGVKEYNVHFAAAFIAAAPTLLVYIISGKYFVRGLMSGAVKG
ncbi:carbohydrate ABC transporter permease [Thorsellia anophelis]|uniref:Carbohydrate ABC transporter membrane protein 2, CUT1 family (TC 3.A.1.1.-) n=1 Tax=Thorsellia anophelis DSM 18579 TaxID=1123402 RepID=A0A1H9ZXX5_9GAMM|nr:carbohydrate ABC transporter permease [Thorsellia anophelis]SES86242.1 carbohydrate ABC transporter membrane protein 2, CUT1 family (TC 3.A.1.1.-) [Thorsellia anophelis DSM 18579]